MQHSDIILFDFPIPCVDSDLVFKNLGIVRVGPCYPKFFHICGPADHRWHHTAVFTTEENPCTDGAAQVRPMLFKGQLDRLAFPLQSPREVTHCPQDGVTGFPRALLLVREPPCFWMEGTRLCHFQKENKAPSIQSLAFCLET